jgi:hypothetical protein
MRLISPLLAALLLAGTGCADKSSAAPVPRMRPGARVAAGWLRTIVWPPAKPKTKLATIDGFQSFAVAPDGTVIVERFDSGAREARLDQIAADGGPAVTLARAADGFVFGAGNDGLEWVSWDGPTVLAHSLRAGAEIELKDSPTRPLQYWAVAVIDRGTLYQARQTGLYATPLSGGEPKRLSSKVTSIPFDGLAPPDLPIRPSGDALFVVQADAILRVARADGAASEVVRLSARGKQRGPRTSGMVVDRAHLYYSDTGEPGAGVGGSRFVRCSLDGAADCAPLADTFGQDSSVGVDERYFYYTEPPSDLRPTAGIMAIPKTGGLPRCLAVSRAARRLVVGRSAVYWLEGQDIWRVDK